MPRDVVHFGELSGAYVIHLQRETREDSLRNRISPKEFVDFRCEIRRVSSSLRHLGYEEPLFSINFMINLNRS